LRILAKENAETFVSTPISARGATGVSTLGVSAAGASFVVFIGLALPLSF